MTMFGTMNNGVDYVLFVPSDVRRPIDMGEICRCIPLPASRPRPVVRELQGRVETRFEGHLNLKW